MKRKNVILFLLLLNMHLIVLPSENPLFGWFQKRYDEYTKRKQEEAKKEQVSTSQTESSKIDKGRAGLENRRSQLNIGPAVEGVARSVKETFSPKSLRTLTKNVSLKLGLGSNQTYPFLFSDETVSAYILGNNDPQNPVENFAIKLNDTVADIAIIKNNKTDYKFALLVGQRDSDKKVSNSKIYIGTLPIDNSNSESFLPVMNTSEENSSNMVNQEGQKTFIKVPNRIASNGKDLFFTQAGSDILYKCTLPTTLKEGEKINEQKIDQYTGIFGTDLTSTNLAKIKGDFATENVFFASKAPNLYMLDQSATAIARDKIAGAGYLLDAYQNTVVYGRLYNEDEWYSVLWDKFTGKLNQFKSFITGTEGGGKKGTKVRRIGYYAKFYGRNTDKSWIKPHQISLDEDYEEAKMMAPVDTVLYGDQVKNYVMIPAAASEQFATVFIGKRRGMHFAIQSRKGQLFPKMLSWYKILKHSLYSDQGNELNIAPEDTLPRKLFIVQHKQNEHYLCIVMRSHVFLIITPLEKINPDPNKNYNVAMYCIYKPEGGRQKKKIVASSFFAENDTTKSQALFLVVRDDETQNLREKFTLLFFNDLSLIIEDAKSKFRTNKNFDPNTDTWTWVKAKHEDSTTDEE